MQIVLFDDFTGRSVARAGSGIAIPKVLVESVTSKP